MIMFKMYIYNGKILDDLLNVTFIKNYLCESDNKRKVEKLADISY